MAVDVNALPKIDPRAQKTEAIGKACPMFVSSQISDIAELMTAELPLRERPVIHVFHVRMGYHLLDPTLHRRFRRPHQIHPPADEHCWRDGAVVDHDWRFDGVCQNERHVMVVS